MESLPLPVGFHRSGSVWCEAGNQPTRSGGLCSRTGRVPQRYLHHEISCVVRPSKSRKRYLPRGTARALVINAGNANACTGKQGIADATAMTAALAAAVGCATTDALVASTGVIGRFLPMDRIEPAMRSSRGCGSARWADGSCPGDHDDRHGSETCDTHWGVERSSRCGSPGSARGPR